MPDIVPPEIVPPEVAPSGGQYEISFGDQQATIVEVGGGVRRYVAGARAVLDPYEFGEICDGVHGAPLIPWPNRLADGRYRFDDVDYQVALTEPEKANAIHGFLHWRNWVVQAHEAADVVMATVLYPLSGYPFTIDVSVGYHLDADGLTVTTTATNIGRTPAPWACGAHPYLSPGDGLLDEAELELRAALRIDTDAHRQLPTAVVPTAGTPYSFATRRRMGDLEIDFAFRELDRDGDGRAWVRLTGVDGQTAALWVDASFPLVEIYTGDTLAPHRRRRGLGVEPMSAPPNAFASGDGVIRLEPEQTIVHRWGARLQVATAT